MLGRLTTRKAMATIKDQEFVDIIGQEARVAQSMQQVMPDGNAWFDALLVNHQRTDKERKLLSWYRDIDQQYGKYMKEKFGNHYMISHPTPLTTMAAHQATDYLNSLLETKLSLSQREILKPFVTSTDQLSIPVEKPLFITLSNYFRYRIGLQLNLPNSLTQVATGNVEIDFAWQNFLKLPENAYANVTVKVLSGYDTTADYYWQVKRDYVQQVMVNKLKAYQGYMQEYEEKPFYEKWFDKPMDMNAWTKANEHRKLAGSRLDKLNDPRVVDFLDHDQMSEDELMTRVEDQVSDLEKGFNILWHDCLHYPVLNFHNAQMVIEVK